MLPHKVIFRIPLVSVSLKLLKLQQFSKNKAAEFNSNALEIKNSSLIINILLGLVFVITSFFLSIGLVRLIKTNLKSVISQLLTSSNSLEMNMNQIKKSSETRNKMSARQASGLQQTVSAVDEINSVVRRNSSAAVSSTAISNMSTESEYLLTFRTLKVSPLHNASFQELWKVVNLQG